MAVTGTSEHAGVRLAELVGTLSLATDLGLGQPMEHCLRSTLIALRLGDRVGIDESERTATYYVSLLAWVCCHADAHEQAFWFGDDIALHAGTYDVDMAGLPLMAFLMRRVGAGSPPLERARRLGSLLTGGMKVVEAFDMTHCILAGTLAERLGLGAEIRDQLQQAFERWDGKGAPNGLRGEQIALPVRIMQLAEIGEVFHRLGGVQSAIEVAAKRRGSQFDPRLVDLFCDEAEALLGGLEAASSWPAVIGSAPALERPLDEHELDRALEAIADFADLKSPYTAGHTRGVAELAAAAARGLGLPDADVTAIRRAGLLHDLGRLGIPNTIWDKRGPLSATELERVRMHPYLTDRMLASAPGLAPLAPIASQHHERLDGSGYPRGASGAALGLGGRILAAADVYHAMTEPRPHRPELPAERAADELRAEVRAGRLDGEAVNAVLRAAGHRVRRRREFPAGLTPREVEVLTLVARGRSNREVAERLHVTPRTVASHVEHIYAKIDVSNRAAATLFATQHGLLGAYEPQDRGRAPNVG